MAKKINEVDINYGERFIDEEFLKAVGRMTINFAHLEFVISLLCGSNMKTVHPINEIVTSELSFKQLINITLSILKITHETEPGKLTHITNLLKKSFELEQKRNSITHSFYGTSDEVDTKIIRNKITSKGKAGFQRHVELIDAAMVNTLADTMEGVSSSIALIIFDYSLS